MKRTGFITAAVIGLSALTAFTFTGCGGNSDPASPEDEVRTVVEMYQDAVLANDTETACAMFSDIIISNFDALEGECELRGYGVATVGGAEITNIAVSGDTASVAFDSASKVELEQDDDGTWIITKGPGLPY